MKNFKTFEDFLNESKKNKNNIFSGTNAQDLLKEIYKLVEKNKEDKLLVGFDGINGGFSDDFWQRVNLGSKVDLKGKPALHGNYGASDNLIFVKTKNKNLRAELKKIFSKFESENVYLYEDSDMIGIKTKSQTFSKRDTFVLVRVRSAALEDVVKLS